MTKLAKCLLMLMCALSCLVSTALADDVPTGSGTVTVEADRPSKRGGDAGSFADDMASRVPGATAGGVSVNDPSPSSADPCSEERRAYEQAQSKFEEYEKAFLGGGLSVFSRSPSEAISGAGRDFATFYYARVIAGEWPARKIWDFGPKNSAIDAKREAREKYDELAAAAKAALAKLAGCEFSNDLADAQIGLVSPIR